ncbi:MAG: DivIVA domain-containing protein [Clostridia bacterium]|nr:DivIVA domain-containing protein [Clostridia bacterium]
MEAKLKKGALGYKSKEVEAYLIEMSNKYLADIKEKDEQIAKLNAKIERLEGKIDGYEEERLSVADALVKAQKEAQDILDAAVTEAEAQREKIRKDCDILNKKIDEAKDTLAALQKDALKVMEDYKAVVEEFTDFSGIGDED